jgi:hypothetical protein
MPKRMPCSSRREMLKWGSGLSDSVARKFTMLSASAFSLFSKMGSGLENFSNQVLNAVGWMMGMVKVVVVIDVLVLMKSEGLAYLSPVGRSLHKGKIQKN